MENNSRTVRGRGGPTVQNWRSIFFLQSFVKSRPTKTRRNERVPLQIVSLKHPRWAAILECRAKHDKNKPKKSTHVKDFRITTIKRAQLNQQRNFLRNRWRKTREKTKLLRLTTSNYAWNIHLTICSKMAFSQSWLVEIATPESLQTAIQPPLPTPHLLVTMWPPCEKGPRAVNSHARLSFPEFDVNVFWLNTQKFS